MIGLILPTHTHDPARLMASVAESQLDVRWYIFHHSENRELEARLERFSEANDVRLYLYRQNRGLARSWNEGINQSLADKCEQTIILNDDLHFSSEGFSTFITHLRNTTDFGLGFIKGLEIGGALDGQIIVQGMACFAINKSCLDAVGYFDEGFVPAYFEDLDYLRRMRLAGCSQTIVPNVIAEHHRSSTLKENTILSQSMHEWHELNRRYYEKKWGPVDREIHTTPFGDPSISLKIEWSNRHKPYPDKWNYLDTEPRG